ncbi:hypothetical protein T440DRAFT_259661 [Plenodomus tracheiphilus IPT5]|uniref:Uncharacterized protein n=1 Tax=Plenodomus tracheiphilus IPT5 TaxID=1408161 RepID=A0A6A7AU84_9PLEO|nr:hypothetical protein T440DRAFT_259661 [Plenodomus tracheiphilus IPT5]
MKPIVTPGVARMHVACRDGSRVTVERPATHARQPAVRSKVRSVQLVPSLRTKLELRRNASAVGLTVTLNRTDSCWCCAVLDCANLPVGPSKNNLPSRDIDNLSTNVHGTSNADDAIGDHGQGHLFGKFCTDGVEPRVQPTVASHQKACGYFQYHHGIRPSTCGVAVGCAVNFHGRGEAASDNPARASSFAHLTLCPLCQPRAPATHAQRGGRLAVVS